MLTVAHLLHPFRSCGVILFVFLAGYLPFEEENQEVLFRKMRRADFAYPDWFTEESKDLMDKVPHQHESTADTGSCKYALPMDRFAAPIGWWGIVKLGRPCTAQA
jgi:hypothetical protein